MIKIFIEGQELDVNEGFTHQITYAIDDIQNIDSKATAFSKTIVLPGTSNNNKLLGNIFEFGNSNFPEDDLPNVGYNFNAAKSARVLVQINGLIILKGALRLLEIIVDGENIEYEVALFGELGGFVSKLGNKKLTDLDFTDYNHTYNATNIIGSWDDVKSFSATFTTFQSGINIISFFSENVTLVKGDKITVTDSVSNDGEYTVIKVTKKRLLTILISYVYVEENLVQEDLTTGVNVDYTNYGHGYFYPLIDYGLVSENKNDYHYKTFRPALYVNEYINKIITNAGYTYESNFFGSEFFRKLIVPNNDKAFFRRDRFFYIDAEKKYDQPESISRNFQPGLVYSQRIVPIIFDLATLTNFTESGGVYTYLGLDPVNININTNILYDRDFDVDVNTATARILVKVNDVALTSYEITNSTNVLNNTFQTRIKTNDTISIALLLRIRNDGALQTATITILEDSTLQVSLYPEGFIEYQLDDAINIQHTIPNNILQKDFFTSILKMFNLMVTEDKFVNNHLVIEPYVDFYNLDRTSYLDWSDKLDRSEPIRIKPMSELNARYYEFKYKSDSDYYNELYRKRFNEGYGDRKYDNEFEFSKETSSNEVIFSATPLVGYQSEAGQVDKIVPAIMKWDGAYVENEEKTGSNIRIMQSKRIEDVTAWDLLDIGIPYNELTPAPISGGNNLTAYGYAGHFDDPDAPNSDINFGATNQLFFNLVTGALSNNLFNAYYSPYMAEITDKDSRLFSAKFKLNEKDIFNLDFGRFIWIDGVLYRLIKIYDYSEGELCKVDLLRVIYTTY